MNDTITYKAMDDGTIVAHKQANGLSIMFEVGRVSLGTTVPANIDEAWVVSRFGDTSLEKMNQAFADAFAAINTSGVM